MSNIRLPMAVCAAVADVLSGSHAELDALFVAAGAPGPPPDLAHKSKWKTWLFRVGNDPDVDSLAVLGNLIEEFMDLPPLPNQGTPPDIFIPEQDPIAGYDDVPEYDPMAKYNERRARLVAVLEDHGLRYFRGGRVLPSGEVPLEPVRDSASGAEEVPRKPSSVEELLEIIVRGLSRAIHPLQHRRRDAVSLTFESEYDIQDLLHSQLRPWIADIRPEEFTPSYAGSSTRMDFLLPVHKLVIEIKRVRDKSHARKVGDELIIDIEHYRRHPDCQILWCAIYDPRNLIQNPPGLIADLEGSRSSPDGAVNVRVFVLGG